MVRILGRVLSGVNVLSLPAWTFRIAVPVVRQGYSSYFEEGIQYNMGEETKAFESRGM